MTWEGGNCQGELQRERARADPNQKNHNICYCRCWGDGENIQRNGEDQVGMQGTE